MADTPTHLLLIPSLVVTRHLWRQIMPTFPDFREAAMPTRNVVFTDHQAHLVEKLVSTGRYQNASEVLREGLRMIEDREAQDNARLHALREAARVGMADIDAGRFRSFESPAALNRHLTAIAGKVIAGKPATRPK